MKKDVYPLSVRMLTLVVTTKQTFLHGKYDTFRTSNPQIIERTYQIACKKA